LDLGGVPLEEQGVADSQQRWTEEHTDEAEGEDAADEPEEPEHHGQIIRLTEQIGPEDIVDAADEEQTPRRDEDTPPNVSLDEKPKCDRGPNKRRTPGTNDKTNVRKPSNSA
jgi:hypothetical protein